MVLVASVGENDWDKDGTIVKVTEVIFDDGSKAPGYDLPERPEVGKPLPQGWEVATAKSGKPYIKTPKQGKGSMPAAFRNTKEGQAYEQERMDRRTALMQANDLGIGKVEDIVETANTYYAWLRQTSGAVGSGMGPAASGNTSEEGSAKGKGSPSSDSSKYVVTRPAPAWPSSAPASPAPLAGTKAGEGGDGHSGVTTSPPTQVDPPPAAGAICNHPLEQQYEATSGRIKCRICKAFVD